MTSYLEAPVTGYRYEYTDGHVLQKFAHSQVASSGQCLVDPRRPHAAPDERCVCGIRVVKEPAHLSEYLRDTLEVFDLMGMNPEQHEGQENIVLCEVEATGLAEHGQAPPEDPPGCLRVQHVRLKRLFVPQYLDGTALGRRHGVPVADLEELGREHFGSIRHSPPVPSRNQIAWDAATGLFSFVVGPFPFDVPGSVLLEGTRMKAHIARAMFGVLEGDDPEASAEDLWSAMDLYAHIPADDPAYRLAIARGVSLNLWRAAYETGSRNQQQGQHEKGGRR